jgi:LmeA-like phospholipid-binding
MSSDPTRPLPPPEWNPDAPTQQYPGGGQRPQQPRPPGQPRPTFTPNDQHQPQQPYQPPQQPYQPPQQPYQQQQYGSPQQQYQPPQYDQQYQDDQQYMGAPPDRAGRPRRRRRRWPIVTGVIVILLLLLAVAADRFACYEAENQMANQIQQSGLPVKPHVSIEGFPFLTQLAAKDFNDVVISASNVTEDGLTIASINATLHGMHLIDGYSGARIDTLDGSALITFKALANAGSFPSGVTLGPGANPSQIKATLSVPVLGSVSATVQVTKTSANKFTVKVVDAGGIESSPIGNLANYTYTVPQLPAGMNIQGVTVTQQGVLITITGKNTTLTQS